MVVNGSACPSFGAERPKGDLSPHEKADELGISGAEIAGYLGIDKSSINRALVKMDELMKK